MMSLPSIISPPTSLPYFCDPANLPDPLPTSNEIEMSPCTLPTIRDPRHDRIVLVKGCFLVKYGIHVTENEGHALLLERHPTIPAPRLYAMYRQGSKLYLIMSVMPGRQVGSVWGELSEHQKLHIVNQLGSIWNSMRSIPSPSSFSSIAGGPLRHRFFLTLELDPKITGPFETERDLNQALALRSKKNWEGNQPWTSGFFERHLPSSLQGHGSVLTHGDVQRKNILVEELPSEGHDDERRFRVSAILDWEDAGWYPSYWEYAASFADFIWVDDWPEKFESILDPCPLEAAMLKILRQDLDY